jgi:plasmid maintenance system killer protein
MTRFNVLPLRKDIIERLKKYGLERKFDKQIKYLEKDPRHPGLILELLEPRSRGIYSIRIDRKYRALLRFLPDRISIEIIVITNHHH